MSSIHCNYPNCNGTFATNAELRRHIESEGHQDAIIAVVRNLDYAIKTEDLQTEFAAYNPREVRVNTRTNRNGEVRSRGFGYAFFNTVEDRDKAVAELNNKKLGNREVRVSVPKPRPAEQTTVVHISKLTEEAAKEENVRAAFPGKELKSVKITVRKPSGDRPAYAFADVEFADRNDYIEALKLTKIADVDVVVEPKKARRPRQPRKKPAKEATPKTEAKEKAAAPKAKAAPKPRIPLKNTIFVGKVPADKTAQDVKAMFEGKIVACKLRRPRRFHKDGKESEVPTTKNAFVSFETEEDYKKALEVKAEGYIIEPRRQSAPRKSSNNGNNNGNRKPRARKERSQRAPIPTMKDTLFVGNLPDIITEDGLKEVFEGCKIKNVQVNESRMKHKYGVVEFVSEEEAKSAFNLVKGTIVEGREIKLEFKRVPRTEEAKN